jgi:hypothetical protein
VSEAFSNLDLALRGILDQKSDTKLFENIATKAISDALATATKLHDDVKNTAHLAKAALDRQQMLHERVKWAGEISAKAADKVPAEAKEALADASAFAKEKLDSATDAVVEKLRNAQPEAPKMAAELSKQADAKIERLTKAFLLIGRQAGVPDPR